MIPMTTGANSPTSLRAWLAAKRAGEDRERQELRDRGPRPAEAIAGALALIRLARALQGWPIPEDEVSRREDQRAAATRAKLRVALLPDVERR